MSLWARERKSGNSGKRGNDGNERCMGVVSVSLATTTYTYTNGNLWYLVGYWRCHCTIHESKHRTTSCYKRKFHHSYCKCTHNYGLPPSLSFVFIFFNSFLMPPPIMLNSSIILYTKLIKFHQIKNVNFFKGRHLGLVPFLKINLLEKLEELRFFLGCSLHYCSRFLARLILDP